MRNNLLLHQFHFQQEQHILQQQLVVSKSHAVNSS
jgi:hypothetical protein